MVKPKYRRVLLKISGEALAGEEKRGINESVVKDVVRQIKEVHDLGVEIGVVVGGGNFWRGRTSNEMNRPTADYIGMLATVMNSLALQDAFEAQGVPVRVFTAIDMQKIAEPYSFKRAIKTLEEGCVVIFGAGTGSPYFSTDTTAALRAAEIEAEVILFAKNIDAVYSDDPKTNPDAVRYDRLTHTEVLSKDLKVMDSTAASMCRDNNIGIHVFGLSQDGNIMKAVCGEKIGTLIV